MTTIVIDPAPRPPDLDGARLVVLDTGGLGSATFLEALIGRLEKRHFLASVVTLVRSTTSRADHAGQLQQLVERCDVVITGVTQDLDSVAATASDVARLERLAVPCAVVATTAVAAAVAQALVAQGFLAGDSVIEVSSAPRGDRLDLDALVEQSFRQIERALTAGGTDQRRSENTKTTARNAEVTCEC